MNRYHDIDPMDLDPDTGAPYGNYSSPSLDTSFHDGEMNLDDEDDDEARQLADLQEVRLEISRLNRAAGRTVFNPVATQAIDRMIERLEDGS